MEFPSSNRKENFVKKNSQFSEKLIQRSSSNNGVSAEIDIRSLATGQDE